MEAGKTAAEICSTIGDDGGLGFRVLTPGSRDEWYNNETSLP
jgi:hypothetical protein